MRALEADRPPQWVGVAWCMTKIKDVTLVVGIALTLVAVVHGARRVVVLKTDPGWTGVAALANFGIGDAVGLIAAFTAHERRHSRAPQRESVPSA